MLTVTKNVYLCFDNYIYAIHTSQIPYPVHQHCPTTYCITELTYSTGAVSISREEHAFRWCTRIESITDQGMNHTYNHHNHRKQDIYV